MTKLTDTATAIFNGHMERTPFTKPEEAKAYFVAKIDELLVTGYKHSNRWSIEEYALRCTECKFSSIIDTRHERVIWSS